jgi:bacterioferritin-associated ferredoxin
MSCSNKNSCCRKQSAATPDFLVCTCMGVMHSDIINAIDQGADTYEKLQEILGVGTGCSSCVAQVHEILNSRLKSGCGKS